MTKLEKLIKEVLELDELSTPGPWNSLNSSHDLVMLDHVKNSIIFPMYLNENKELVAHYRTSAPKLAKALQVAIKALSHCEGFDTSAKFGYDYNQEVRGHKPGPGERWLTPKEKSRQALTEIEKLLGDEIAGTVETPKGDS